ncbi:hypothetical protein GOODEAATRI_020164 [Goodea atripinnis]|uniref:Uncharacterized protein n=1 Tax=Goodea atripinnis TaxID=208336 RepID=A0ABV0N2W4_9TELE
MHKAPLVCKQFDSVHYSSLDKDEGLHGRAAGSTAALKQEGPGFESQPGSFCLEFHVLLVNVWVLSGYSSFLPQFKNMTVRSTGYCKLSLGVSVCMTEFPVRLCVVL